MNVVVVGQLETRFPAKPRFKHPVSGMPLGQTKGSSKESSTTREDCALTSPRKRSSVTHTTYAVVKSRAVIFFFVVQIPYFLE